MHILRYAYLTTTKTLDTELLCPVVKVVASK